MNTQVLAHQEVKKPSVKVHEHHAQVPPMPKFEFYTLLANEKTHTNKQSSTGSSSGQTVPATNPTKLAAVVSAKNSPLTKEKIGVGTQQQVSVKVVDSKPVAPAQINASSYLVQVAAFKIRNDAEHMKGLLTLKGFNVHVVSVSQATGNWFRVLVGPYTNRNLAQKAQFTLAKNERLRGMIVNG